MSENDLQYLWQQTYSTLFATTNKLQMKGDAALKHLTSRQLMLIIAILHLPPEDTTVINISKMLGASKQSTVQILEILKSKKYIVATKSQKDGRAVNIVLTPEGMKIATQEFNQGMDAFAEFFKNFTKEELILFWGFLKKLYSFDDEEQTGFER